MSWGWNQYQYKSSKLFKQKKTVPHIHRPHLSTTYKLQWWGWQLHALPKSSSVIVEKNRERAESAIHSFSKSGQQLEPAVFRSQANYSDLQVTTTLNPFTQTLSSQALLNPFSPKSVNLCFASGSRVIKTYYYVCHVGTHKQLACETAVLASADVQKQKWSIVRPLKDDIWPHIHS